VSSPQPRRGHCLLRCPLCKSELTAAAGALVCRNRHRFDLAREGYVNLLRERRRQPAAGGDGVTQLWHRAEFLDAGHLDGITTAIAERFAELNARRQLCRLCILDAGSGTGHHLARLGFLIEHDLFGKPLRTFPDHALAAALARPVIGLGLDISKDATRQASRRRPTLAFAVSDLWTEWPVRDAAVDLVVSIFAPKNVPEAARVLRPGGWLVLGYPGPDHLIELRSRFGLLRQREGSAGRYRDIAQRVVGRTSAVPLRSRVVLDRAAMRAAVLMGPNAHHIDPSILDVELESIDVTFDINLLFAQKPGSPP
jgi:23S rRNA (guanine745-N1)-methyltransferase